MSAALVVAIVACVVVLGLAWRVRSLRADLRSTRDRAQKLQNDLAEVRDDRAQHAVRADTAEAARDDARESLLRAEQERDLACSERASITAERDAAVCERDELVARQRAMPEAATLWALELARLDRRWHVSVAPGINMTSPLVTAAEADIAHVALDVITEAIREETGTRIIVNWQLTRPLDYPVALLSIRALDEVLSSASLGCETMTVQLRDHADQLVITIDGQDEEGQAVALDLDSIVPHELRITDTTIQLASTTMTIPFPRTSAAA